LLPPSGQAQPQGGHLATWEEAGWIRHSQFSEHDYNELACRAKAAAMGYVDMCVRSCTAYDPSKDKEWHVKHCAAGHALHAPEHNAWDNYALLEAIWADPQCYRRVMGRRQGSQARRSGGAGVGGRGGAGGRDNNRNSARAGGGGKGAPSAATGAKGGEKGAKGAPAQGAAARGRSRARGGFRGQVARQ
jgi:hypothetical protein